MIDFVIVGGGLAGTTLAWRLWEMGVSFRLIDDGAPRTSSRVAAGLLTPITGQRPTLSWRWDTLAAEAFRFYPTIEAQTGERFFHPRPMVRIFDTERERQDFETRFVDISTTAAPLALPNFDTPHGGAGIPGAARLDVQRYLTASQAFLTAKSRYHVGEISITPHIHDELQARHVIFCQGFRSNPLFPMVRFAASKGEILTLRIPDHPETRTINRLGKWLTHITADIYRAGSTYDRVALDSQPTEAGRGAVLASLAKTLRSPVEVLDHQAGVRPIIHVSRPILGVHPDQPRWAFFNGLGSKGSLTAPYFAKQLAEHLVHGQALDPEVGWDTIPLERTP
ncbi:MAG: NAD(P)/FAD-dependent oxidoreductase [Fimbriiglobus sp.]